MDQLANFVGPDVSILAAVRVAVKLGYEQYARHVAVRLMRESRAPLQGA